MNESLPKPSEVAAMVQSLIPEGRPYQGMRASAVRAPGDVRGYYVTLDLRGEEERVGGKALCESLADYRDSKTGGLPEMVEQAATKLAKRVTANE